MNSTILILSGISGSGKTTLANNLIKDGFFLLQIELVEEGLPSTLIYQMDTQALNNEQIVVDGFRTYSLEEINSIADILRSYSHTVIPLILHCDPLIAERRISQAGNTSDTLELPLSHEIQKESSFGLNALLPPLLVHQNANKLIFDAKSR